MKTQIQIKTKAELLDMGYENNNDPFDFLNLLSSKIVTVFGIEKNKDNIVCEEYPDYVIPSLFVKKFVKNDNKNNNSFVRADYTFQEIADIYKISPQRANAISQNAESKLKKLFNLNKINSISDMFY